MIPFSHFHMQQEYSNGTNGCLEFYHSLSTRGEFSATRRENQEKIPIIVVIVIPHTKHFSMSGLVPDGLLL